MVLVRVGGYVDLVGCYDLGVWRVVVEVEEGGELVLFGGGFGEHAACFGAASGGGIDEHALLDAA